jgi:hypothetical protein
MDKSARFLPKSGLLTIVLLALSSGCTTPVPPVEVTRFHTLAANPDITGSFAIVEVAASEAVGISLVPYRAALRTELQKLGLNEGGGASNLIVRLSVERSEQAAEGASPPVAVGVGGSTGSFGSGLGVGVGINLGGRAKPQIVTEMAVQIRSRAGDTALWEGRASSTARAGTPQAQPGLAAAKLATALFRDFPGRSGATIAVP